MQIILILDVQSEDWKMEYPSLIFSNISHSPISSLNISIRLIISSLFLINKILIIVPLNQGNHLRIYLLSIFFSKRSMKEKAVWILYQNCSEESKWNELNTDYWRFFTFEIEEEEDDEKVIGEENFLFSFEEIRTESKWRLKRQKLSKNFSSLNSLINDMKRDESIDFSWNWIHQSKIFS